MQSHLKLSMIAVLIALLFTSVVGCAPSGATEQPQAAAIEVTDMAGRSVRLEAPAQRVVALTASCCEILYALEAGDTLAGRGEFCDYPQEALALPQVQSGEDANIEQIISLDPQLVLMGAMAQTQQQIDALEKAGIPVVVTDAQNIEEVYESIALLGTVLGREEQAERLAGEMRRSFAQISSKIPAVQQEKTVYFEISPLEYGLWTAGENTFMNEIAQMLGLRNAFEDVEGWAQISEEQVLERDPDYIVTVTMYFGEGPEPQDEIASRSGWQELKAVKNKQVFVASSDEITRPGPRLVKAAELLYQYIYENAGEEQAV